MYGTNKGEVKGLPRACQKTKKILKRRSVKKLRAGNKIKM